MALLSDATIIIEAGEGSGTLHQGWEALRLGRPLFILSAVVQSGLMWPQKMLDYGAIVLSGAEELHEALPIEMDEAGGDETF
jgi:DNA processing protein